MKLRTPNYNIYDLPDRTYLKDIRDFGYQFLQGRHHHEKLDVIRHLFVNEVPLYMVSYSTVDVIRWIRDPFNTFEESMNMVCNAQENYGVSHFELFHVNDLNELHVSYEEDEKGAMQRQVHDYTEWCNKFGDRYLASAQIVFSGLTEEHQKQFLPEESRQLLVKGVA
jgi:hypothetical protein